MGDREIWEGVDGWYQLANKSSSRALSFLKITSSCFFLTTVSTRTLEGRDCCRSFAERLPGNSKCKMKKKNIDVSRMVCTFSLNIIMNLLKKSHQKGWIQSECKASLSFNICFCTKRRWTAKYTATGPSIKNPNKHLLKSRSHSQSTQLTKESTKDSRTPPLEKWSMTIRYLLSLFRKTIGSEIKRLLGQEHFFFRLKKQIEVICE